METINNRISVLRKHLGLNQTKFAQKIGVSSQHISMFEAGKAKFSETTINLICLTFGVRETWLKTGEGDMMDDEALLSDQERQLLDLFRRLSAKARILVIEYLEKVVSDEAALRGEPEAGEKVAQSG
jgi:transcriptional regulator with XRE-family HTH domain